MDKRDPLARAKDEATSDAPTSKRMDFILKNLKKTVIESTALRTILIIRNTLITHTMRNNSSDIPVYLY